MKTKLKILMITMLLIIISGKSFGQCPCAANDYGSIDVAGWTIGQTGTITNCQWGGERSTIQNTVPGAVYLVSSCGAIFNTELTIYTTSCVFVAYNNNNGPACAGNAASVQFTSPGGDLYSVLNRNGCNPENTCVTITIQLISLRPCGTCIPDIDLGIIGTTVYGYNVSGNCGNGGAWVASFTGEAGATYHFDLCPTAPGNGSITTNWDPDIKITNSSCTILTGVDGSCSDGLNSYQPNDFQWTCTTAGTYYVIIAPYSSYSTHNCTGTAANAFTMNYYKVASRPCGNCTPTDADLGIIGTTVYGYNVSGNCGNGGAWVASFTGEAGATYHFDLCPDLPGSGSITTNWDADIKITNSSCTILTGVDGSCSSGLNSWQPNDFQWTCITAGTYYVIIAPYSSYAAHNCIGTSANAFTMNYYKYVCPGPMPVNDNCSSVTPIALTCDITQTFTGTGACSTSELLDPNPDFKEVWIAFNIPSAGMDLKIDFCGSTPIHDNAYLNVFTDCSFETFTPASDWDLTTCGDGNITLYWTELPAGNYWYPVLIDPAWETDYVANVTAYCCTRPVNDLCTSVMPVALTCGTTQTFTGTAICSTPTPTFDPDYKDVWIAFTLPVSMDVAIDFCTSSPIRDNAYINVFPDCSFSTFTSASSWDFTSCADGNLTLFWTALAPGNYYYPIYIDNPTWEAPYTVNVLGTCPLPIQLLSFDGSCTNDLVTLTWATATETNNSYFTLEKSTDMKNWKFVKQISGAGNSNQRLDYNTTDEATGDTYYRLKQTDFDGKFEIFSPISVNCSSSSKSYSTVSIHPNPTTGMLYIQTSGSEISGIQIFEDNGKTIYTGKEAAINMASFAPGLYYVKIITTSGDMFFRKVIKQ